MNTVNRGMTICRKCATKYESVLGICPNCGTMIEEDTKECPENSCGMEFYWD